MSKNDAAQPPNQVQVQLPSNLDPVYANFALITHSPSEIVIDFAQLMPQMPQARVRARIVMTPMNAKLVLRALGERIGRFEALFGEITIPEGSGLADQLFRARGGDAPEGEEPRGSA
ncbi:MAG: DUF3467 domain-containing protein [Anaerolineales bacterium]|nr:DUF3467 domain-containing protein [Anaerolineales bacterium]